MIMNTSEHTSLADQIAQACAAGLSDNEQATRRDEAEAARRLREAEAQVSRAIKLLVMYAGNSGRANEPYLVLVNITDLNDRQPPGEERLSDYYRRVLKRCRQEGLLPRWAYQPCPVGVKGVGSWQLRIWLAGLSIDLAPDSLLLRIDMASKRLRVTDTLVPLAERMQLAYAFGRAEQIQNEERTRQRQEQLRRDAETKAKREVDQIFAKLPDQVRQAAKSGDQHVVVFTLVIR
jgi:hypothetical protein